MIGPIDTILRATLLAVVPGLTANRIGFQPPDAAWRNRIGSTPGVHLNACLVDITEDRELRSNATHREIVEGVTFVTHAPTRIRLHYLITAWNAAADAPGTFATEAEHTLLGVTLARLLAVSPLNPSRVLPLPAIQALPTPLQDLDLPTRVAPAEGFPRLADFWGTMGRPQAWRPAIYLAITAPVIEAPLEAGGIVDTILFDVGRDRNLVAIERLLVVGGLVSTPAPVATDPPLPVGGARVDLYAGGIWRSMTTTDDDGSFAFEGLAPGTYEIGCSHPHHPALLPQPVTVPLASGPIELVLN